MIEATDLPTNEARLIIQFGIPTLDELLGKSGDDVAEPIHRFGLRLQNAGTSSLCIVGPDGTGKSVLGLHLASRYAAQTFSVTGDSPDGVPAILYISTDLNFKKAEAVW